MISRLPQFPPWLTDPRPVLAVGCVAFAVATAVVWLGGQRWESARPVCLMGMAVGLLAYIIYLVQRRGARRGDKGAQTGL